MNWSVTLSSEKQVKRLWKAYFVMLPVFMMFTSIFELQAMTRSWRETFEMLGVTLVIFHICFAIIFLVYKLKKDMVFMYAIYPEGIKMSLAEASRLVVWQDLDGFYREGDTDFSHLSLRNQKRNENLQNLFNRVSFNGIAEYRFRRKPRTSLESLSPKVFIVYVKDEDVLIFEEKVSIFIQKIQCPTPADRVIKW